MQPDRSDVLPLNYKKNKNQIFDDMSEGECLFVVFVEQQCHSASRRKVELAFVVGNFLSTPGMREVNVVIAPGGQEIVSRIEIKRTNRLAQPAPGEPTASLDRDYQ